MSIAAATEYPGRGKPMENDVPMGELIIVEEELNAKSILEYVRTLEESTADPALMMVFVGLKEKLFPRERIEDIVNFAVEKEYVLKRLVFEYQGGLVYSCDVPEGEVTEETTVGFYLGEEAGKKNEKLAEQLHQVNLNRFIVLSGIVKEPQQYVLVSRSMLDTLGKAGRT
jgi:hypothetical protein